MPNRIPRVFDLELLDRGDGDFDAIAGDATIELSRDEDGSWTFWGVRIGGQQIGGTHTLGPGEFYDWLNSHAFRREGRDA